jgi:hypothetical protein
MNLDHSVAGVFSAAIDAEDAHRWKAGSPEFTSGFDRRTALSRQGQRSRLSAASHPASLPMFPFAAESRIGLWGRYRLRTIQKASVRSFIENLAQRRQQKPGGI